MYIGYLNGSYKQKCGQTEIKALREYGCNKIFQETSDSIQNRPELERMLYELRKADVVVVWKLDRIGKSVRDLIRMINLCKDLEADFVSIQDNIDTRSTQGKFFYKIISLLSESEKNTSALRFIKEPGPKGKRRRNGGRPVGLSQNSIIKARKAKQLYEDDKMTVTDIAISLGIGKTTLYRYLRYAGAEIVNKTETGLIKSDENEIKMKIRKELFNKLLDSKSFWSYSNVNYKKIPDEILIQKVMEELDIDDIKKLFIIYNKNFIRRVWKEHLVIQDPFYRSLNILLAKLFFNISKPENYIDKVKKARNLKY